jgi:hypothetical protein
VDSLVLVLIALLVPALCWRLGKARKFLPWIPVGGALVYAFTSYFAMMSTDQDEWASTVAFVALLVGYVVCMLFVLIAVEPASRDRPKT